ncbi:MAG: holo-ACP synthase [Planctomycetota bacterium]|nr:holo-ACP synthase [Planctomycetota bacterium]
MIVGVGVDAVEIARIGALLERSEARFERRVFTAAESEYCRGRQRPAESYAARFAAKEAALKCLGTGWSAGAGFRDVEVSRLPSGDTELHVTGAAGERARELGITRWHVSLTHTETTATAFVVAEG